MRYAVSFVKLKRSLIPPVLKSSFLWCLRTLLHRRRLTLRAKRSKRFQVSTPIAIETSLTTGLRDPIIALSLPTLLIFRQSLMSLTSVRLSRIRCSNSSRSSSSKWHSPVAILCSIQGFQSHLPPLLKDWERCTTALITLMKCFLTSAKLASVLQFVLSASFMELIRATKFKTSVKPILRS